MHLTGAFIQSVHIFAFEPIESQTCDLCITSARRATKRNSKRAGFSVYFPMNVSSIIHTKTPRTSVL